MWNEGKCTGAVAAFNVQGATWSRVQRKFVKLVHSPPQVLATVSPADVDTYRKHPAAARFVTHVDSTGEIKVLSRDEGLPLVLDPSESEMVTIAPLRLVGDVEMAAIGLKELLNTGFAVRAVREVAGGLDIQVKGSGTLLVFASSRPKSVVVNGGQVSAPYQPDVGLLSVPLPELESSVTITA